MSISIEERKISDYISKLPLTKDGVPVFLGDKVYIINLYH